MARLLRSQVQGVLAIVDVAGLPSTHLMAYSACPELRKVFLATPAGTRKDQNMRVCPAVSVLWDDRTDNLADHSEGTLATAAGSAKALAPGEQADEAMAALLSDNPNMNSFLSAESTVLFCVEVAEWGLVEGYSSTRVWQPTHE